MNLFIDDYRDAPEGWTLVRTMSLAIRMIVEWDLQAISIDHDMKYLNGHTGKAAEEQYVSLLYILRLLPEDRLPKTIYIHSANVYAYDKAKSIVGFLPVKIVLGAPQPV